MGGLKYSIHVSLHLRDKNHIYDWFIENVLSLTIHRYEKLKLGITNKIKNLTVMII